MNITKENSDALNATLLVKLEKEDYDPQVEKILKDYRKKARIDGFRPGMVPAGLIRKMYRKPVLVEEINKIVSEALGRYLVEEKIQILGEPLPSEQQTEPDWDQQESFEFKFDLGLAPEFSLDFSEKLKVPFYEIKIDKKMSDGYLEDITRRFGKFSPEEIVSDDSMLKADFEQCDENGGQMENGVRSENVSVSLKLIKDKDTLGQLKGKAKNEQVRIDIHKAFPNETEISSMLNIQKTDVAGLAPHFLLTIREINKFDPAKVDQQLYDQVFGEGAVKTKEEFTARAEEDIRKNLQRESEYRFQIDARNKLIEKSDITLPSEFLKKWLLVINEGKYTEEEIDHDFVHFENDLKWQLIRNQIIREQNILATEEEILEMAKQYTLSQFQRYGLSSLPDEEVERYAKDMLNREEDKNRFQEKKLEEKVYSFLLETVKLDKKKVNSEEFNKLFEEQKQ